MKIIKIKDLNKYDGSRKNKFGLYKCFCGKQFECLNTNINTGNTKSCGCLRKINASKNFKTHGLTNTKVYRAWCSIKRRCYNKNDVQYHTYGGRGITVSADWKNSFETFYKDMGEPPTQYHSIDRIDNDKGYSKNNCKWSTMKEQSNNKSTNRFLEYNGQIKTLTEWSNIYKIESKLVYKRLDRGWDLHRALTQPKGNNGWKPKGEK